VESGAQVLRCISTRLPVPFTAGCGAVLVIATSCEVQAIVSLLPSGES
jgi:hypothetical protein